MAAAKKSGAASTSAHAATRAAAKSAPYSGQNPFDEGTPAWHAWAYLKSTVDADRARGIDVTKVDKTHNKPNTNAF